MIARNAARFRPSADAVKMSQSARASVAASLVQAHLHSRAQKKKRPTPAGTAQHATKRAGFRDVRRVATSRVTHGSASDSTTTSSQQGGTCDLSAGAKPTCSQSASGSLGCSALVDNDLDTRWASQHRPAKVIVVILLWQRPKAYATTYSHSADCALENMRDQAPIQSKDYVNKC